MSSPAALREALLAADAIFLPDPQKATAGIHFAKVLGQPRHRGRVAARLRLPQRHDGDARLAAAGGRPIGCTQTTEIVATPGVALVAPLPKEHELATVYTAGVNAGRRERGARLRAALDGDESAGAGGGRIRGLGHPRRRPADAAAPRVVCAVLAEYGLQPEPAIPTDLMDLEASFSPAAASSPWGWPGASPAAAA